MPMIITKSLGDSAVVLEARSWVNQPDYFATRFDLTTAVKYALDDAGISIPFPHRQIVISGPVPTISARASASRAKKSDG